MKMQSQNLQNSQNSHKSLNSQRLQKIKQHGFTMIELSIVIVILALLAGSIIGGVNFMQTAKLRKQIGQIQNIEAGVSNFRNRYSCFPGDCADPTILAGYTYSGDGNGFLSDSWNGNENKGFWLHLSLAEMLDSQLVAHGGLAALNAPLMALGGGIVNATGSLRFAQNILLFAQSTTTTSSGVIFFEDILHIDDKIDDALPNSGIIRSIGYDDVYASSPFDLVVGLSTDNYDGDDKCISAAAYSATATHSDCNMVYILSQ